LKYVYPSRTEQWWWANMAGATAWLVVYGVMTALLPDVPLWLTLLSMAYPAYYLAESLWLTFRTNRSAAPRLSPCDG
jgi:phosphatidylcholine synthase